MILSWALLLIVLTLSPLAAHAIVPLGDCSFEGGLGTRTDIVLCEPWERPDWWTRTGYVNDGSKTSPAAADADHVFYTSIVTTGCLSGKCLKVDMPQHLTDSMGIHFNLDVAMPALNAQQLFLRYYIKLGPAWTPDQFSLVYPSAGKFPGLADPRTTSDPPPGQCGNGGDQSDGLHCWSARANYQDCFYTDNGPHNACADAGKPGAIIRFGTYGYVKDEIPAAGGGIAAQWDGQKWPGPNSGQGGVVCTADPTQFDCGLGSGGLLSVNQWYLIEMFVKMNTPGQTNGVLRGWVNGVLSYEKLNIRYRDVGHDNLHVRTIWLNVYKGGVAGNNVASEIYLDQLVAATDFPIGAAQPPVVNNVWTALSPAPSSRWVLGAWPQVNVFSTTQFVPTARSYGGIAPAGNGHIYYFGGGHGGYSGNDVEDYTFVTNQWTQSYQPEWCDAADTRCSIIYGGPGTPNITPLGRSYTEHMYQKATWHPGLQRMIFWTTSGVWQYNPVTHAWVRYLNATTGFPGPLTVWNLLSYDPDRNDILGAVTLNEGNGRGIYRLTATGWVFLVALPAGMAPSNQLYSAYIPEQHVHILYGGGNSVGDVWHMWKFNAVTLTFTDLGVPPPDPTRILNAFEYDSVNKVMIGLAYGDPGVPNFRVWKWDPSGPFTWTPVAVPAVHPAPVPPVGGVAAWAPSFRYDAASNLFLFFEDADCENCVTNWWSYRYAGGAQPPPAPVTGQFGTTLATH